jgi:hypothetical protein
MDRRSSTGPVESTRNGQEERGVTRWNCLEKEDGMQRVVEMNTKQDKQGE